MAKALDSIRVAIRVRPLLKRENGCKLSWKVEDNTIFQLNDGKMVPNGAFTFDRIFDKDMATIDLYMDFAKSIVVSVMEGINGTLFAYGQTASGKTHTMSGDENAPGIIPHSLKEVFDYISETENREFLLRVSYMEIYNEVITDLLKPKHTNLKIHENAQKEVFVGDLTEQVVTSVEEIIDLMKLGERNRHFGCTNMNERSSRSHTIFRMVIESRETSNHSLGGAEVDGAVKVSHLNLVDLAGSERASATGAEGIRLREGGFINKSLFALGNVINKLSEGESTFVPFRDSKLTRILQTSLGGNAKTSIICAVTPASMDETLSTLQFASRAKTIKNRPEVNEVLDETTLLKRYRKEINVLKKQLEQFANTECIMELQTEKDKMEQQLLEQREVAAKQREKLRKLANFFCTAQPRETEKQIKRNKRRWTVCPMGVLSKPPNLQLNEFMQTNKRLKSIANSDDSSSPDSGDFQSDRLDRFFCEMDEKEDDIEEFMPNAKNVSIRRSGSLLSTANDTSQEKRDSFAENVTNEKIEELKLELKRVTEERDAAREERDTIHNDLSENISSSCEIQEDLVKTKQVLREKKQKIRELQESLDQAQSRKNLLDKKDEEKQASLNDMCLAKEDVEKKLTQSEHRAETEAAAKEEAAKECQRLHALTQALEEKVDVLTVVQSELESVDALQVELCIEQEKNGDLEDELRKKKEDCEVLREEMKRELENSARFQHDLAEREVAVSQTIAKFDEAIENLQLLEDQNGKLRLQIEELSSERVESERDSDAVLQQLQLRVQELADENASLILKDRETEGKVVALQEELSRNLAVVVDLKSSMEESAREHDEIVNERSVEVSELQENIRQLERKLKRQKRKASHHSSIQTDAELESPNPDFNSLVHDTEDEITPQTKSDQTVSEDEADKISDEMFPENTKSIAFEELTETNSLLVEELEKLKQELLRKSTTVQDLEAKLSKMQLVIACRAEDESSNVLPNPDVELKERLELVEIELRELSEAKRTLEEELSKATAVSETLKEQHGDEMDSLRKDFDEDLAKRKGEVDEKVFLIDELEVNLIEVSEAKESLMVELESSQDRLAKTTEDKLQLAAILEEKSNAIEKLEGELKDVQQVTLTKEASSKDNEEMVGNLRMEFQEQLERKVKELEEVKITVHELNGLLSKRENGDCEVDEESKRATEELKEMSREMAELQSQLEEALVCKETFVEESGQRMADLQRKFDENIETKRGELEGKSGEIADLQLQLEGALSCKESLLVAQFKEQPIADPQREFDEELERNGAETQGESEEIAGSQKLVEETAMEKQAFCEQHEERVAELQKSFNEALERKDAEIQAKANEIEQLNEQLEQERVDAEMRSGKDPVVGESVLGDIRRAALQNDLEQMNAKLEETSKTTEEALSGKEELQKKHEDFVDYVQGKFRDEFEQKNAELEEQMAVVPELQEKLQHAISSKEASTDSYEDEIAQLRKTFDLELEKKNSELEEQMAVVSELQEKLQHAKEASTDSYEDEIAQLRKTFGLELEKKNSELEEQMAVVSELQEKLQHAKEASTDSYEDEIAQLRKTFGLELEKKNSELLEQLAVVSELQEKLQHAKEASTDSYEDEIAQLPKTFDLELEKKNSELLEQIAVVSELQEKLQHAISSKEASTDSYEDEIAQLRKTFDIELEKKNSELLEQLAVVSELQEKLQHAISSKEASTDSYEDEIAQLRKTFDVELEKKNSEAEENSVLRKTLEEKLDKLIESQETDIAVLKSNFDEEIQRIHAAAEAEKCNVISELEESLNAAIAGRDLVQRNGDEFATLRQELELELQSKNDVINDKNELITSLEEQMMELKSAKEDALQEHENHIASVRKELNDELEKMRSTVEEKSTLCAKLEENLNAAIAAHDLVQRNGDEFATLRQELELELQGKNDVINDKNELITSLEEQMMELKSAKEDALQEYETRIASVRKELNDELEKMRSTVEEKSTLCAKLEENLNAAIAAQDLVQRNGDEFATLRQELELELQGKNDVINDKNELITSLEEQTMELKSAKEDALQEHNTHIASVRKELNDELEKMRSTIEEIEVDAIAGRDLMQRNGDEFATLRQELEVELQGKNDVINEKNELITSLEEQMMELKSAKEDALQEHENHIASVRKELNDELEKMRSTVEVKSTLCAKLEENLNAAIAGRDLMQRNGDEFATLRQELELELQSKNDVINDKNELITSLEEQMMELKSSKEDALQEYENHIASVRKELNDELEKMRSTVEEKSSLCAKLEDEKQTALSSQEGLIREHEVYINGLKDDFSAELKRVNAVVGEKSSLVDDLEEKIMDKEIQCEEGLLDNEELRRKTDALISEVEKAGADVIEKTTWIEKIDLELASALKSAGNLAEERDKLLGEYQSLEKQLVESRGDCESKSKEMTALEKKVRDVDEAIRVLREESEIKQDGLRKKCALLEGECEKMKAQVHELVDERAGAMEKDGRISELTKQVEQLTKDFKSTVEKSCVNCSGDGGKRRESLVFKSMLEDIKEEVTTENEDKKQDKLIDELSYTLMVTQEKLEQKEFVIDEKEIEILEKETQVQHAEENSRKSQEFAKMQKEKLAELYAQIEHSKLSDQNQSTLIEKLHKQLTQADNTNNEEQEKRCNLERTLAKQRDKIEGYNRRVEELEAQKEKKMENMKDRNEYLEEEYERVMRIIDEMESEIEGYMKKIEVLEAAQTENDKIVQVKNRNEYLEEEYERVMKIIDEMEAEIEGYTKKIEELETQKESNKLVDKMDSKCTAETKKLEAKIEKLASENESFAKREVKSAGSSLRLSQELSTLKCQHEKLKAELRRLQDSSLVDLEEELKKVRNELKTKELDLYHITYENTKQMDTTKSRIRELEKDRANYSRKNNELRTEIRRLRSQDDEPTMDIMKNQQTSRCGDVVGVVGSVALFTLDAKVAKLEEENRELKQKIETLQQKNDTLNIMSLDLKQRHSQLSEKYYKLKEQFSKNADITKATDHQKPTDQKPPEPMQHTKKQESELLFTKNPRLWAVPSGKESHAVEKKPTDEKPSEPMQHTKKQDGQLLFGKQPTPWAGTSSKESHTVKKPERKPTVPRQNKENSFPKDKPDACKTQ